MRANKRAKKTETWVEKYSPIRRNLPSSSLLLISLPVLLQTCQLLLLQFHLVFRIVDFLMVFFVETLKHLDIAGSYVNPTLCGKTAIFFALI